MPQRRSLVRSVRRPERLSGEHVPGKLDHVRLVVLAKNELGFSRLRAALHSLIDDEPSGLASDLTMLDGVDFAGTQAQPHRQVVEEIPLRLQTKHACEELVAFRLRVPVHVRLGDRLHGHVRHGPKPTALSKESEALRG
ncbi:MAG: hypothetical protein M3O46_01165 [Myxococcota bacterium]|nr:hypothetical protein [Myxococcota bacterium]